MQSASSFRGPPFALIHTTPNRTASPLNGSKFSVTQKLRKLIRVYVNYFSP